MNPKNPIWLAIPFLLFFSGYILMSFVTQVPEVDTPSLLGKQLNEAVSILSKLNLNARILNQKEDLELPEGTIISQTPKSGSKIKPNQSVFIITTKKPGKEKAPSFIGLKISENPDNSLNNSEVAEFANSKEIKTKIYKLKSNYPTDTVVSQSPEVDYEFPDQKNKTVLLYVSSGNETLRIFPDLRSKSVNHIKSFLSENGLKFEIIHPYAIEPSHTCQNCAAKDQRPLAGSLINPEKPFTVYISAEYNH